VHEHPLLLLIQQVKLHSLASGHAASTRTREHVARARELTGNIAAAGSCSRTSAVA
jgi:hypothetical protein